MGDACGLSAGTAYYPHPSQGYLTPLAKPGTLRERSGFLCNLPEKGGILFLEAGQAKLLFLRFVTV